MTCSCPDEEELALISSSPLAQHLGLELGDVEKQGDDHCDDELGQADCRLASVETMDTINSQVEHGDSKDDYSSRHSFAPFASGVWLV
jgi:hypothetical protein